jgi:hypothetical protein
VEHAPRISAKPGETATAKVQFRLANGFHTNSNTPPDEYLIPLRLTWEAAPLEVAGIDYPKGTMEKYSFSEKPLSVYSGVFEVTTRFKVPVSAPKGARTIAGKLRYQACTSTTCYPPKTLAVQLPVEIK